ncbi:MAG: SDR family NAD(P)-dependent oxidoreductase [bacterium]
MKELEGKIAVVTGGARGIGKAIAQALAKEDAQVILCDLDYKSVQNTANDIRNQGFATSAVKMDVSCSKEVKRVFEDILNKHARVDILINNAGICSLTPFEDISEEEWDKVISVNLKGTFLCCQAVMRAMISQRGGKIVNIASLAGKVGGILVGAHYSAAKAGIICLTKSLAKRMALYEVNVNAVAPGPIKTEMTEVWPENEKEKFRRLIPLGDFGNPEDVAETVLFLVSDRARFITGEIIDVNGGALMD